MDQMADSVLQSAGMWAAIQISLNLVCIAISWWVLQNVRWDIFLKMPGSAQAKLLQIIGSVVLGHLLCQFLLVYAGWSSLIKQLVE